MKKAVIYDRWLHTLGGGEVVACTIARLLKDLGYKVSFISGKKVSRELIYEKLRIDLSDIDFVQVWNDELALRKLVTGSELFINVSFMDYSRGFARKNVYFVNFPTKSYESFRGLMFSLLVPIITNFIKPIESMNLIDAPIIMRGIPSYLLNKKNKYAIYNLQVKKVQIIEFNLYIENFSMTQLRNIEIELENGQILDKKVKVFHEHNVMTYVLKFIPNSNTVYLNININKVDNEGYDLEDGKVYLLYPKVTLKNISAFIFSDFFEKVRVRLRAGIFVNVLERLSTYNLILTYSFFAQRWIRKYWKRQSVIIAPPVALLFNTHDVLKSKKKNWICSVGRFFTLGHGKKQEILVEAFKKIIDEGHDDWELHLVGGLGSEPSSLEFFKLLKEKSKGFPIFFHINASRSEVEEVYLKSKIYWHATGFGEDEDYQPIRFEHFGIAPIEAISAKCVPILYKGGGLVEIIDAVGLDRDKYLFENLSELVNLTIVQIREENPSINWNKIFSILKNQYSLEVFKKNFLKVINS